METLFSRLFHMEVIFLLVTFGEQGQLLGRATGVVALAGKLGGSSGSSPLSLPHSWTSVSSPAWQETGASFRGPHTCLQSTHDCCCGVPFPSLPMGIPEDAVMARVGHLSWFAIGTAGHGPLGLEHHERLLQFRLG